MMKKIIVVLILLYTNELVAQESESISTNKIYLVTDSGKYVELEKSEAEMKTKTKLAGFGGSSSAYVIDGTNSKIAVDNTKPSFAVRMNGMMMGDPSQFIRLYRFDKKDKTREVVISSAGIMGKGAKSDPGGLAFDIKNGAKDIYIIVPEKTLPAGEYGFLNMMLMGANQGGRGYTPSYTVFTFSVK